MVTSQGLVCRVLFYFFLLCDTNADTRKGKILDVGADWGLVDPRTGIFSADTRYNFRTHDGEDIFLQTSGPKAESGDLHLRIIMETGSEKYYWVNNIVGMFSYRSLDDRILIQMQQLAF